MHDAAIALIPGPTLLPLALLLYSPRLEDAVSARGEEWCHYFGKNLHIKRGRSNADSTASPFYYIDL